MPAGDNVFKYQQVEMFYHREPETRAKFVVLTTESGQTLSLTELHLIPLGECPEMAQKLKEMEDIEEVIQSSVFARKAKKGDCVVAVDSNGRLRTERIVKVCNAIKISVIVDGDIVTTTLGQVGNEDSVAPQRIPLSAF